MPTADEVRGSIKTYILEEVLEGDEEEIENTTPLLKLGVLNSMEIVRLVSFINREFGVWIPNSEISADNFKDLDAITNLVMSQEQSR